MVLTVKEYVYSINNSTDLKTALFYSFVKRRGFTKIQQVKFISNKMFQTK